MEQFYRDYFRVFNQLTIDTIFDDDERMITGDEWIDFRIWKNYHNNQWKIWEEYD